MRKQSAGWWALAGLLLLGCSHAPEPVTSSGAVGDPRFQALLTSLKSELATYDIPGASVAIVEAGKLSVAAGVGYKRRGDSAPVTPSTRFRVASMSKMLTAAAALRLVEEGKLDLSRPITDYVPLPLTAPATPTTAQLLSHTSGLPDVGATTVCPIGAGQNAAWFAQQGPLPLWAPPGALWNYSNRGFAAAGWIVETVSGQSFEEAVTTRIINNANMTTATYDLVATMAGDHATGTRQSGALEEPDAYDCAATRPPSGILATPTDYAHFAETLLAGGGAMLTPASVAALTSGHVDTDEQPDATEKYGYGMFVRDGYKGLHVLHHDGEVNGWRSDFWLVPDRQLAVILFYNDDARAPSHVVERAIDLYLALENVAAPDGHTPPADWTKYTGSYLDPNGLGAIGVWLDGATLHASVAGYDAADVTLTQNAGDAFEATFGGGTGTVTFYPGPAGPAQWIVTRRGVGARR